MIFSNNNNKKEEKYSELGVGKPSFFKSTQVSNQARTLQFSSNQRDLGAMQTVIHGRIPFGLLDPSWSLLVLRMTHVLTCNSSCHSSFHSNRHSSCHSNSHSSLHPSCHPSCHSSLHFSLHSSCHSNCYSSCHSSCHSSLH